MTVGVKGRALPGSSQVLMGKGNYDNKENGKNTSYGGNDINNKNSAYEFKCLQIWITRGDF